jgi:hypothetical protein
MMNGTGLVDQENFGLTRDNKTFIYGLIDVNHMHLTSADSLLFIGDPGNIIESLESVLRR